VYYLSIFLSPAKIGFNIKIWRRGRLASFLLPAPKKGNMELHENETHTVCPGCGGSFWFPNEGLGMTAPCPHCGLEMDLLPRSTSVVVTEPKPPEPTPPKRPEAIIATTGNEVSGRTVESYLGIARGIVVRSPDIIQGMFGGLKQIVGGNIESYAKVCEEARQEAFFRMIEQAKRMNAHAIIALRYDATEFAPGVTEVMAYGTAVTLSPCKA
jgi:uncharacterized protein YbjQ (UPF0145 family)